MSGKTEHSCKKSNGIFSGNPVQANMYHASPAIHAAEKKSTSPILMLFSFRVMADHSRFCCPATNPMNRPIPVPNKAPSPTAIRISNKLALIQTLHSGCPSPNINSCMQGTPVQPVYRGILCTLFSAYVMYEEQDRHKPCNQGGSGHCCGGCCYGCPQGYRRKSDSDRQGLARDDCDRLLS